MSGAEPLLRAGRVSRTERSWRGARTTFRKVPALSIADEFAVQQGLSSSDELAHIKTLAALSSEPVERRHVDWVKVSERLLQFVRGRRGIHQEAHRVWPAP